MLSKTLDLIPLSSSNESSLGRSHVFKHVARQPTPLNNQMNCESLYGHIPVNDDASLELMKFADEFCR